MITGGVKREESPKLTQKERRDRTRGALLDATVDCLLTLGYAHTSTLEVQRRAGVSRGALLHHFPSRASLMAAAVRHLAELRGRELKRRAAELPEDGDRIEAALDLLWESFSGALFTVAMELRAAARTDPELKKELAKTERQLRQEILSLFRDIFGARISAQPTFADTLEITVHLMIGMAMNAALHHEPERTEALLARWKGWLPQMLGVQGTPRK